MFPYDDLSDRKQRMKMNNAYNSFSDNKYGVRKA